MKKRRKTNRGGTKIAYDGHKFASGLERYCYMQLKKHKLFEGYEEEVFTLIDGFSFSNECYSRTMANKGDFTNRGGKKILPIRYTPDFTGEDFIIECKGYANESFPMRWKLFKLWLTRNEDGRKLYKPSNQKEVDRTIQLIIESRKSAQGSCIRRGNSIKM